MYERAANSDSRWCNTIIDVVGFHHLAQMFHNVGLRVIG